MIGVIGITQADAPKNTDGDDWLPVRGNPGYEVSRSAQVRSSVRGAIHLLKPGLAGNGYKTVALRRNQTKYIHRLVAETFIPNPSGRRTVNHKDGDKTNNVIENLEWASYSENILHGCRVLQKRIGEKNVNSKLTLNDALEIISLRGCGADYKSLSDAYAVSKSAICHILHGRTWGHVV